MRNILYTSECNRRLIRSKKGEVLSFKSWSFFLNNTFVVIVGMYNLIVIACYHLGCIPWNHWVRLYRWSEESTLSQASTLTNDHIYPKGLLKTRNGSAEQVLDQDFLSTMKVNFINNCNFLLFAFYIIFQFFTAQIISLENPLLHCSTMPPPL